MFAQLRHEADKAAQEAIKDMIAYQVRHGGKRNPLLEDVWHAADRVVQAVDELEKAGEAAAQAEDPEAPDYTYVYAEGDLRADWGNR